ncbi:hypothetical protein HUJ04_000389, partial [Dendroctonus ponderosae]
MECLKADTSADFVLYAHDTTIVRKAENTDSLNGYLSEPQPIATDWLVANQLSMNDAKSQKLILSTRATKNIPNDRIKFLGVKIDSKLSWKPHLADVCSSVASAWGHAADTVRVFAVERRAIRILSYIGYRDNCRNNDFDNNNFD